MVSTTRPGRGDMTRSLLARKTASSIPCVMKNTLLRVLRPDVEDQFLHLLAGQRVERAERLVHQQHVGIGGESARDADALTHAARQLPDAPVLDALEINEPEHLSRSFADVRRETP